MRALVLLLALAPAAGASPASDLFDGSGQGQRLEFPSLPQAPAPPSPGVDLSAARARFGNEAMIAALPRRSPDESFSFGVIGDAEPGRFWWERLYSPGAGVFELQWQELQAQDPDFILQLGDFVSKGTEENYAAHVRLLEKDLDKPLLRCVGNHDRSRPNGDADKKLYDEVFGPRDYFFDHGGWRFISLDSSDRAVTSGQLSWLRQALSVPGPKVIYTHVPPAFLKSQPELKGISAASEDDSGDGAVSAESEGYIKDFLTAYFQEGSAEFESLVSAPASGVRLVLMGHIHAFWVGEHRGVRYIISGGGGSPLYPLPPGYHMQRFAHVLWATAHPNGDLDMTVEPLSGGSFALPPLQCMSGVAGNTCHTSSGL